MRYEHRFRVRAPLAAVADFHSHAASMQAITPPPMFVRVHSAPASLGEGDEMDFTMWVGPLPLRWVARIEDVSPEGFTDCQLRGPFQEWRHRHTFVKVSDEVTEVVDQVDATLRTHSGWWLIGLVMWIGLPVLFSYRGRKTRRLLKSRRA